MRISTGLVAATVLALGACDKPKGRRAEATLEARSGSTATGTAVFVEAGDSVQATITVDKVAPGRHGLHLHEQGDCSAADAESAGPHWNPDAAPHGAPGSPAHAGDLGNIEVGPDGTGRLQITMNKMTILSGAHSVVGRAVVLHENADDLMSQPAGNSGARIACGVIAAK